MQQLEKTKGKIVEIPQLATRYLVAFYDQSGWHLFDNFNLHTNPESALQSFYSWQEKFNDDINRAKFYKIIEIELEIPFIPNK